MANNVGDDIGIADDSEIETPPAVDPRLPLVIGLAVGEFHRAGFVFRLRRPQPSILASIEAAISSAVLNGPKTRPCLMSSSDFASRASMMRRCAGVYSSSALANSERSITSLGVSTILPRSAMPIAERRRRAMSSGPYGGFLRGWSQNKSSRQSGSRTSEESIAVLALAS